MAHDVPIVVAGARRQIANEIYGGGTGIVIYGDCEADFWGRALVENRDLGKRDEQTDLEQSGSPQSVSRAQTEDDFEGWRSPLGGIGGRPLDDVLLEVGKIWTKDLCRPSKTLSVRICARRFPQGDTLCLGNRDKSESDSEEEEQEVHPLLAVRQAEGFLYGCAAVRSDEQPIELSQPLLGHQRSSKQTT